MSVISVAMSAFGRGIFSIAVVRKAAGRSDMYKEGSEVIRLGGFHFSSDRLAINEPTRPQNRDCGGPTNTTPLLDHPPTTSQTETLSYSPFWHVNCQLNWSSLLFVAFSSQLLHRLQTIHATLYEPWHLYRLEDADCR